MKKLLSVFLLISEISLGQITAKETPKRIIIGEVKASDKFIAEISATNDTCFLLMFKNEKYPSISDIKGISFTGSQTLSDLYKILSSVISDKDYKADFKLGGTEVSISNRDSKIWVWTDKGYFFLTEKQLNRLFGK